MTLFSKSPIALAQAKIEASQVVKPNLLERIGQKLSSEQAEVEAVKARLAEKEAEAAAIANQFNSLVHGVHLETENLNRARIAFQSMQNELRNLEGLMLDAWSNTLPPDYKRVVSLRAAIEDFPRVQRHLENKVAAAQKKLEAFEKAHS
jgi:chromosome segregation ATPase